MSYPEKGHAEQFSGRGTTWGIGVNTVIYHLHTEIQLIAQQIVHVYTVHVRTWME